PPPRPTPRSRARGGARSPPARPPASPREWRSARSAAEPRGDLVDAGFGADFVLVAAGRARDADRAHHVVAGADRQAARGGGDLLEMEGACGRRRRSDTLAVFGG